jgi:hypothetical protein
LYFDNEETTVFQYQTRWSPNIEIIQEIAEYYKVDFVQDYEEMGNLIYGQAIHHNEILQDIYLEDEDFEQYEYDEETIAIILRTKNLIAIVKFWKSFWNEKSKISLKLLKTNSYDTFKSYISN